MRNERKPKGAAVVAPASAGTACQDNDLRYMRQAMGLAEAAAARGDVPVGALVVCEDTVVGLGYNCKEKDHDPTGHAEIVAIRAAAKALGRWRLWGCTLYVTLEPCPMCAGALVHARIDRLVYGASDLRTGAAGSLMNLVQDARLNHRLEVTSGVLGESCSAMLSGFFAARRAAVRGASAPGFS